MSSDTCTITEVVKSSSQNPVLLNFQCDILSEETHQIRCDLAEDLSNRKRSQPSTNVVVATIDGCTYHGPVTSNEDDDVASTFIAIRNKRTNKIRLIPVEQCTMILDRLQSSHVDNAASSGLTQFQLEKIRAKEFGGKMASRKFDRQERQKVNVGIIEGDLNESASGINAIVKEERDDFDLGAIERQRHLESIIPERNLNAKSVQRLYTTESVVPADLLKKMEKEAIAVLETDIKDLPIESKFLIGLISKMQKSLEPDSEENMERVKLCIFVDALMRFINTMVARKPIKNATFSDITTLVEEDIRRRFTQPQSGFFSASKQVQEKAICHCLVALFILGDKFEINLNQLSEDIKITKDNMIKYVNFVGGIVRGTTNVAVLKMPTKGSLDKTKKFSKFQRR